MGEGIASDGVGVVGFEPWDDVSEFENVAGGGDADGVGEGLEGEGAGGEGEALEGEGLTRLVAAGGAEGVGGGPFGVGDVEAVSF